MYKTFSSEKSKINCDYKIIINDISLYVEIAGVIYNDKDNSWRYKEYTSKRHSNYKNKLLKKEKLLLDSGENFLFLFKTELLNGDYKNIFQNKIKDIMKEVA